MSIENYILRDIQNLVGYHGLRLALVKMISLGTAALARSSISTLQQKADQVKKINNLPSSEGCP